MTRQLIILGSTGSIGVQALEIVAANPDRFTVVAITSAGSQPDLVIEQARKFKVKVVGVNKNADQIRAALPEVKVVDGPNASTEIAAISCDVVLNAITGSIGLAPTLAALDADNRVALANKESLVAGGDIVTSRAKSDQLLPVDSEHSALWQALIGEKKSQVSKLILTASGGPFRDRSDLESVTVAEALSHPTWVMGPVVTINSATLMNKGLEVIEAHWLFNAQAEQIDVVVHPQSIIHSMVEYVDGSVLAQLGTPDMRTPIAYALAYPNRIQSGVKPLDFTQLSKLEFEQPDYQRFPCLSLAFEALKMGGNASAIVNAANEVAVSSFIQEKIGFNDIARLIESVLNRLPKLPISSLDHLLDIDTEARAVAHQWVEGKTC